MRQSFIMFCLFALAAALLAPLTGCTGGDAQPLHQPDNTITVAPDQNGRLQAFAPACAPYDQDTVDRFANDPLPQIGCSTAANLAAMVANPRDLVRSELPARLNRGADGGLQAAAVERYRAGKDYEPQGQGAGSDSGATAAQ